jgi:hypothetical protein
MDKELPSGNNHFPIRAGRLLPLPLAAAHLPLVKSDNCFTADAGWISPSI